MQIARYSSNIHVLYNQDNCWGPSLVTKEKMIVVECVFSEWDLEGYSCQKTKEQINQSQVESETRTLNNGPIQSKRTT